jgi:hypothetical protein
MNAHMIDGTLGVSIAMEQDDLPVAQFDFVQVTFAHPKHLRSTVSL